MQFHLVVGDWSDDGHGKYDLVLIEANKTIEELQQGYKDSCKLMGIQFNHNEEYTGKDLGYNSPYLICTEYEDNCVSDEAIKILLEHGCPEEEIFENNDSYHLSVRSIPKLIMWFIGVSVDGLEWSKVEKKIPVLNGYWDENLNVQFGYGLYY